MSHAMYFYLIMYIISSQSTGKGKGERYANRQSLSERNGTPQRPTEVRTSQTNTVERKQSPETAGNIRPLSERLGHPSSPFSSRYASAHRNPDAPGTPAQGLLEDRPGNLPQASAKSKVNKNFIYIFSESRKEANWA